MVFLTGFSTKLIFATNTLYVRLQKVVNVSKKKLKKLVDEPWLIGTTDKMIQEGIVFLCKHILENEGIKLRWLS